MWSGPQLKEYVLLHQVSLGWRIVCGRKAKGKINMKPDWPILDRNGEAVSGGGGGGAGLPLSFPITSLVDPRHCRYQRSRVTRASMDATAAAANVQRKWTVATDPWSVEMGMVHTTEGIWRHSTLLSGFYLLRLWTSQNFSCRIHVPLDSQRSVFSKEIFECSQSGDHQLLEEDVENVLSMHWNFIAKFGYKPDMKYKALNIHLYFWLKIWNMANITFFFILMTLDLTTLQDKFHWTHSVF